MRVPYEWLCELSGLSAPVDEVAGRLTDAGFEVAEIHRAGEHWDRVVVGEVVRIDPHPNADRLNLPTVTTGAAEIQVVCGAWNFAAGDRIAFAHEGARLWDAYSDEPRLKELKPTKIRGVVSRGMLCSNRELGLSDDHEGILILEPDAPVGRPLTEVLGDEVIEFELKANRPDALSVLGIAREAAALFGTEVQSPIPNARVSDGKPWPSVHLEIDDPALCARYSAAFVRDVEVAESPAWLRKRLELAGMRPINTIVDVTNYVMLETGQPLHAFDWDTVRSGMIGVRTAKSGERAGDAGRPGPRADRRDALHRGRRGPGGAGGCDGRAGNRGHRRHVHGALGIGNLRPRKRSPHGAPAGAAQRGLAPV